MITGLDHIVVLLSRYQGRRHRLQTLLGRAPAWRSQGDGSRRVLFTLDNMSLELMAPSGDSPTADRIRNVLADQGEGLASICFRAGDIAECPSQARSARAEAGTGGRSRQPRSGFRHRPCTGSAPVRRPKLTRGVRMFFLELAKERPRSAVTRRAPIMAMDHVVVSTDDPERAAALYGARLGLDMALDRSHPDWGRLMFFRCGDLIVEVVHRPVAGADKAHDKLWGLSWRVADIDATRARLLSAGIDVSEARAGRKPGTRVASVRNGTCGIPTLLVERTARPDPEPVPRSVARHRSVV